MAAIERDPKTTSRAKAWDLWIDSPMPMVTITRTFDVTHLAKTAKRRGVRFNALLCYVIGRAASGISEFYMIPSGDRFMAYDDLGINVIVNDKEGDISNCDIPYSSDLNRFISEYERLTTMASENCQNYCDTTRAIIGTSALTICEFDSVVNQYTKLFSNPFLAWGKFRKRWWKRSLPISMQFHHVQMDGKQAATFLVNLQYEMDHL